MTTIEHIPGQTFHGRRGAVENAFRYGVDYVLTDLTAEQTTPWLFSRNRANFTSLHDCDHGGKPGQGTGLAWAKAVLSEHGLDDCVSRILLMAQPRVLGHVFNPVSFWLCYDKQDRLRVVIAEVTNTFGERHSYLCHRYDNEPIGPRDVLTATKIFYVSPFQPVEGGYTFRFDIRPDKIGIWIDYTAGNGGLIATLTGPRVPLTSWGLIKAGFRRPFGSRRVLALIHWQALKLWWKGGKYKVRPAPPAHEVSQ